MANFSRLLLCIFFSLVLSRACEAAGPYLVFDVATGRVIAQDRAGEPWYPASLTKMMTAYVIFSKIKAGKLRLDQDIPVSANAALQQPSKLGVAAGGTVKLDLALRTMLTYSANDMAYALAEAGGTSVDQFAGEMNAASQAMGLNATHYVNPNGLFDARQLTSARDLAVLAQHLISDFPQYAPYFDEPFVMVGKRKLMNHNSLVRDWPEADGMKTGFVCNSGFNLVASVTVKGRRVVAVVLGAANAKARGDLAKLMLNAALAEPAHPQLPLLADIPDQPLGAIVPADLTSSVCKIKRLSMARSGKFVTGWGISFGNYDDAVKADMALRGRLIGPLVVDVQGQSGVVKMAGQSAYAAMIWQLDEVRSTALCKAFQAQQVACQVITPDMSQTIANAAPQEPVATPRRTKRPAVRGGRVHRKFKS